MERSSSKVSPHLCVTWEDLKSCQVASAGLNLGCLTCAVAASRNRNREFNFPDLCSAKGSCF